MAGQLKVAVIYYSATGITYQMAQAAVQAAVDADPTAEVRLRKVRELAPDEAIRSNAGWSAHQLETQDVMEAEPDDLAWADVIVFGTPTRYGVMSAQLKQFIDTTGPLWAAGTMVNKIFTGFCTAATAHGGQEATLLSLYTVIYHWGGIVVAPGYVDPSQFVSGNPYGASHTSNNGQTAPDEMAVKATTVQVQRALQVATALRAGMA
ncbi:NAD(P)H:quinone oxidoreductase [Melissospora conviva]|uniref:NAD(P)H:quinone oxidoreductase n=1 Tax=Melissospora conviva TaxID=3388432 RepID=UPI003C226BD5